MPEKLSAPIAKGQKIGTITYMVDGKEIGVSDILAAETVEKVDFFSLFPKLFSWFLMSERR
jgi:D-alanyl-D-alanine carboxypeptidase (penicillin-binding protein 5/6)